MKFFSQYRKILCFMKTILCHTQNHANLTFLRVKAHRYGQEKRPTLWEAEKASKVPHRQRIFCTGYLQQNVCFLITNKVFSMIFSQFGAQTSLLTRKCQFFNFGVKIAFFAYFKMKVMILVLFVGSTPLGLPFKETPNDILISSVVLPIHPAKVCIYGNLHYVALNLFC